jgi:hypothetical protein
MFYQRTAGSFLQQGIGPVSSLQAISAWPPPAWRGEMAESQALETARPGAALNGSA